MDTFKHEEPGGSVNGSMADRFGGRRQTWYVDLRALGRLTSVNICMKEKRFKSQAAPQTVEPNRRVESEVAKERGRKNKEACGSGEWRCGRRNGNEGLPASLPRCARGIPLESSAEGSQNCSPASIN